MNKCVEDCNLIELCAWYCCQKILDVGMLKWKQASYLDWVWVQCELGWPNPIKPSVFTGKSKGHLELGFDCSMIFIFGKHFNQVYLKCSNPIQLGLIRCNPSAIEALTRKTRVGFGLGQPNPDPTQPPPEPKPKISTIACTFVRLTRSLLSPISSAVHLPGIDLSLFFSEDKYLPISLKEKWRRRAREARGRATSEP